MTFKEMDGKKAESGPSPNTNHPTRQQGEGVGNMLKPKEGLNQFLSPCSHVWEVWGYSETIPLGTAQLYTTLPTGQCIKPQYSPKFCSTDL